MHRSRDRWIALGMGCLFVLVGAVFAIGTWATLWGDRAIDAHGPRAVAVVTGTRVVHDDGTSHEVRYAFTTPDGRRIVARRNVSEALFARLHTGDTLTVAYRAETPSRSFPPGEGDTHPGSTIFMSVVGALLALFGAIVLVSSVRDTSEH
jgi:hypothetical protein